MKRTAEGFRKYVKGIKQVTPYYSNGRKVIVLGEDTKAGQRIIAMGSRWEGNDLRQVYTHCSEAKQCAFDEVYEMYANSRHGEAFSICSHNNQVFTVSWLSDDGLHFITSKREYLVIFNE